MDITIHPRKLSGNLKAIPSKSHAHRLLICAAFADRETIIDCAETNRDIEATAACLTALGAKITKPASSYHVSPITAVPKSAVLPCGESGSTLRFLLPVAGALGTDTVFIMEGRLPQRPLSPLWEEMERQGCTLTRPDTSSVRCTGRLKPGNYAIDGGVSSQFISGLLFALSILPGCSQLDITGKVESRPYIDMTRKALRDFGISTENNLVNGSYPFHSPGKVWVEGDWSNAAFFLGANALGSQITVNNLDPNSIQGDSAVTACLNKLSGFTTISAADIPDLIPVLAVVAGCKDGAIFNDISRLCLKESDRVETVASMLRLLGAEVETSSNTMKIHPGKYQSCTIDAAGDHRIAMAAAIAATSASGPVTVIGADCVSKSYPNFWEDFKKLGGQYEQHVR